MSDASTSTTVEVKVSSIPAHARPPGGTVGPMPHVERPAMTDYGVPADLDGALPWDWAQQRLVANRNYWVVTATPDGRPSAMPVWGVWLPDDHFWFSCSPNARKARNIAANPRCVVTIDDTVECVSVEGVARSVPAGTEAEAVQRAADAYVTKYWDDPAVHDEMRTFFTSHALFEVSPTRAFGIIEREDEFARRATRWRW